MAGQRWLGVGFGVWLGCLTGLLVAAWYLFLLRTGIDTDVEEHIRFALAFLSGQAPIPDAFLFHVLVLGLSGLSGKLGVTEVSAATVLGAAFAFRYFLTFRFLGEPITPGPLEWRLCAWFSLGLAFAFALPSAYFYRGLIPPTVWHNPTTIVLMPFALWLFWLSEQQLKEPSTRRLWIIGALVLVNAIAKPSFLLVFLPIYPLLMLRKWGLTREFVVNCLPVLLGFAMIGFMAFNIFDLPGEVVTEEGSGIALTPPNLLLPALLNLPLSLLLSVTFPLSFALLYPRDAWRSDLFRHSVVMFGGAILISLLIIETGPRRLHGNFGWGTIVCNYLLFATSARLLIPRMLQTGVTNPKNIFLILLLAAHMFAGLHFMAIMVVEATYWL